MNENETIILAQRFKTIRKNVLGLTKEQLAEKFNVSVQFIGQIEKGKKPIPQKRAIALCDLSGCRLDYLLDINSPYMTDQDLMLHNSKMLCETITSTMPITLNTPYNYNFFEGSSNIEIEFDDKIRVEISKDLYISIINEIQDFIEFKFNKLRKEIN